LDRLANDLERTGAATVICLGDSFDDLDASLSLPGAERLRIATLQAGRRWIWIEGNHDPEPPARFEGRTLPELKLGPLTLRHEPQPGPAPGEVAGHLHPCAKVSGQGRRVRRRCFATDGTRLILPAFGAYTGGLNVCDSAYTPVFPHRPDVVMLGRDRVYGVRGGKLLSD